MAESSSKKLDVKQQSVVTPNGEHLSPLVGKDGQLVEFLYDDAKTLYENFQRGMRESKNGNCLGVYKQDKFEFTTYKAVADTARKFGTEMSELVERQGFVGIYAMNRPEWVVVEQACNMFSRVSVPLYDTLGDDGVVFIMKQTEMNLLYVDKVDKLDKIITKILPQLPANMLKTIVSSATFDEELQTKFNESGVQLISYNDFVAKGLSNLKEPEPPTPDDLATICYTSGTTGNPKGVMITHRNIIADASAVMQLFIEIGTSFSSDDLHISYLPLAHMFERIVQVTLFMNGASLGFFRGDITKLMEDIQLLKPTVFAVVPRLLNKLYDKVLAGVQGSFIKSTLFNWGLESKLKEVQAGTIRNNSLWDYLVFRKVQAALGGRVRLIVTGSAPLSAEVFNFVRGAFGCNVIEGYGQTECSAAATITLPTDPEIGHVGGVLSCNMVKLVDIEEMDYFAKDGRGEVCIKGPNCTQGYYKEPEKTAEAIDEDGWLHTGDVGEWMPNGTLKIIDRKKHIFKLAQGEYLAPEKIEGVYKRSKFVDQVFVDGDSLSSFAVAVVVPDFDVLVSWAKQNGKDEHPKGLCEDKEVRQMILEDMTKVGKENNLKGFEQVKCIVLHPEAFTVENDLLTPTFKSKRPSLRKHFSEQIDGMYAEVNANAPSRI